MNGIKLIERVSSDKSGKVIGIFHMHKHDFQQGYTVHFSTNSFIRNKTISKRNEVNYFLFEEFFILVMLLLKSHFSLKFGELFFSIRVVTGLGVLEA